MKSTVALFLTLAVTGCQVTTGPRPQAAAAWTQGTETHGGDLIVAAVKAHSYRLIESTKDQTSLWENVSSTPEQTLEAVSDFPVFSSTKVSALLGMGAKPRPHVVINRNPFLKDDSAVLALEEAARQMIALVALRDSEDRLADARFRKILREQVFGNPSFSLRHREQIPETSLDFFFYFQQGVIRLSERWGRCQPRVAGHLPHPKLRSAEFLEQSDQIEVLTEEVPVVAVHGPITDLEFGYRLDAQAVRSPQGSRIEIDTSRPPARLSPEVLELHEYSHLMRLRERDRHYLFSYRALDCL